MNVTTDREDQEWIHVEHLLRRWLKRAREGQHSHHQAGKRFRIANYVLAVPAIVITTSLGTAAFATISSEAGSTAKAWFGGLSILAAVLVALQTQFRYLERSEKHKAIGHRYGSVRRRIEAVLALPRNERGKPDKVIEEIREKLDVISMDADPVSTRLLQENR